MSSLFLLIEKTGALKPMGSIPVDLNILFFAISRFFQFHSLIVYTLGHDSCNAIQPHGHPQKFFAQFQDTL